MSVNVHDREIKEEYVLSQLREYSNKLAINGFPKLFIRAKNYGSKGILKGIFPSLTDMLLGKDVDFEFNDIESIKKEIKLARDKDVATSSRGLGEQNRINNQQGNIVLDPACIETLKYYDRSCQVVLLLGVFTEDCMIEDGYAPFYSMIQIMGKNATETTANMRKDMERNSRSDIQFTSYGKNIQTPSNPSSECSLCSGISKQMIVCPQCKSVTYCSTKCMRDAKSIHSKSCKLNDSDKGIILIEKI